MRPTLAEQLAGTCRVLEDVILPAVSGAYPAEIMRGLVKNLRMLADQVPEVRGFLLWDNAETAGLLQDCSGVLEVGLEPAVPGVLRDAGSPSDSDEALAEKNEVLRAALGTVIQALPPDDERISVAHRHLVARTYRYPLRMALALPKAERPGTN